MLLCVSSNHQALCLRRVFHLCLAADKILFINFEKYDAYVVQEKTHIWQLTIFIHPNLQKHHIKQFIPKPDKVLIFPPLKCDGKGTEITSINQLESETGRTFTSSERSQLNTQFFTLDQETFETAVMESVLRIPGFMDTFVKPTKYPKKIKRIKSTRCVGCQEEGVNLIVLNCGHECMCDSCANEWKMTCPLCREKIKLILF